MNVCHNCMIRFEKPVMAHNDVIENGQKICEELTPVCPSCHDNSGCEYIAKPYESDYEEDYAIYPPEPEEEEE